MEQKPIQFNQSVQYVRSIREFQHCKISWGRKVNRYFTNILESVNPAQADAVLLFDCKLFNHWKQQTFTRTCRDAKMKTQTHVLLKSGQRGEYKEGICIISKLYNSSPLGKRTNSLTMSHCWNYSASCPVPRWLYLCGMAEEWAGKGQKQFVVHVVFSAFNALTCWTTCARRFL